MDAPTTPAEAAYARALPWIALYNEHRRKARSGPPDRRALYARMAEIDERMVGVHVEIARSRKR